MEKEIQNFTIVNARTHFCLECGRVTWRPRICRTCLERKTRVDLERRKAMVSQ